MARSNRLYIRRRIQNYSGLIVSCLAMLIGVGFLVAVLKALIIQGLPALKLSLFTETTPPPGQEGGLWNAIYGSLVMTGFATMIGTPLGVLAGTYLAEYGRYSRLASLIRFINSILLSSPSIITGFFIYTLIVVRAKHFSAWAGIAALAVIYFPIVVSNTENMLRLVPDQIREAAVALGAPRWRVICSVTLRAARSGIITGLLLGVARISGETAPLLFTALNNQFFSNELNKPMANLPTVIFQYAMSPYETWRNLAWGGAFLITFAVLVLNILAKVFLKGRS